MFPQKIVPARFRIAAGALLLLFHAGCHEQSSPLEVEGGTGLYSPGLSARATIPGQFIVTLQPGTNPAAVARSYGVSPRYTYRHALRGFSGSISEAARAGLLRDSRVLRVEPDGWAYFAENTQDGAGWAVDRLDQRALPLDGRYRYTHSGSGVTAYVIDSGIRFSHEEFGGRARNGYDFGIENEPAENLDPEQGPGEDCHGHGTAVAGVLGGATYGIAKDVQLVSVRLSGCRGGFPISRVVAAVDWVTANAVRPAVANLSLAYSTSSSTLDDAVRGMVAAGIATTVAAGNGNWRNGACNISPARVGEAMTVGSSDQVDHRSTFSNYGDCIDWYAPGTAVQTASYQSDSAHLAASGTSISAPLTAGVAALYLEESPGAAPATVFAALGAAATAGAVTLTVEQHPRTGKITSITYGDLLHSFFGREEEGPPVKETPCKGKGCR